MKLRNKKTGEIKDWDFSNWYQAMLNPENEKKYECNLNDFIDRTVKFREEWEDYEEPKQHWFIASDGRVLECNEDACWSGEKEIGNYFETKEEAEKAVKKLNALERLQKKFNFHITGWDVVDTQVIITTDCDFDYVKDRQDDGLWSDLDLVFNGNLLFGGEE